MSNSFFWIFAPIFCLTGLVACYNNTEDDETVWWIVRPLPYLNEGSDLPNLLLGCMKEPDRLLSRVLRVWIDERMLDIKVTK